MIVKRGAALGMMLFSLAGCTVGPNFSSPTPPKIVNWNDKSVRSAGSTSRITETTNPDPKWWGSFNDPILTDLMTQAISGNLDLQQAVLRVVEARQNEIGARSAELPSLSGNGSYKREQLGLRGVLDSQGVYKQLNDLADQNSPLNQISPGLGKDIASGAGGTLTQLSQPINLYQYGLDASWELDLFGKVRRSVEQAAASTQAQTEATNDALVMLEGQVANAYVRVRGAQALFASQQDDVRAAQESLDLTQRAQRQGLTTDLDVEQARTQLANYEQQLPGYEKQWQQAMNQLSILVGKPPGAIDAMLEKPTPLPAIPRVIGVGVPSSLARRRPDIRQAEAQLHAATANVGVAVASFYPDVSLTGSFGLRAIDASYLTNWASNFYSFGPSISLPIFQGGKLTASLRMARAQEAEAALKYRGTVLNALREVEDALVAYRTDRAARDKLLEAVGSGEQSLFLARDRYTHGLTDFLQVLDAERTLVSLRQQLVQANVTLTGDVIALYNALGGGWQEDVMPVTSPPIDTAPPVAPAALDSVAAADPKQ